MPDQKPPASITTTALRAAVAGLGIPDYDHISMILIGPEYVVAQWVDPTGFETSRRYPVVEAPGVECPQCHTPVGRPHTEYCALRIREEVFGQASQPARLAGQCLLCLNDFDERPGPACATPEMHDDPTRQTVADVAAEIGWVDDGCRCPNPQQHQPGCPVGS